jgi:predicted transcriptional regulator
MKTATIPSLRVEPELRRAVEELLEEGESLSSFVEQALRDSLDRRRLQSEFVARGLVARDQAHRTGRYVDADKVVDRLASMLSEAKAAAKNRA